GSRRAEMVRACSRAICQDPPLNPTAAPDSSPNSWKGRYARSTPDAGDDRSLAPLVRNYDFSIGVIQI
ncbi:MAG: hypothetical protein ACREBC_13520, partial [Pyrinomonadaceae bacterium]